jgi:hypothetical protein
MSARMLCNLQKKILLVNEWLPGHDTCALLFFLFFFLKNHFQH